MPRHPNHTPRESLSTGIEALDLQRAQGFADFIRTGDPDGPVPCWGAIAERFQQEFTSSDDRTAIWNLLVEEGDRRALLLFMSVSRDRPEVMAQVLDDAHRLPVALQRALVSFDELTQSVADHLEHLDPAARQLFEAGAGARDRERELFEARLGQLLAFRYYVPDRFDPADEQNWSGVAAGDPIVETPTPEVCAETVESGPASTDTPVEPEDGAGATSTESNTVEEGN